MNYLRFVLAILAMVVGVGVGIFTSWTNPDMTNTRLWIEYPWRLAGSTILFVGGALYLTMCDWTISPKGRRW